MKNGKSDEKHVCSSMNPALILVNFDFLCRCALSDEGASRLTDVHDNSEEVNIMPSFILQCRHTSKNSQITQSQSNTNVSQLPG